MEQEQKRNVPSCGNWWPRWGLFAVVLLGALLRLYKLNDASLWYDEGATFYVANFLAAPPFRLLDVNWSVEPPLLPVLTWIWFGAIKYITGVEQGTALSDFLVRLLPWTFSVACLPMTYLVSKEITKRPEVGLIATFLVAISPFQIYYAQELRPYASHVLLALCALWCMLRALERNQLIYWLGLTVFLSVSMYNHVFSVWVVVAFNVAYVLTLRTHWRKLPRWTLSQLGVLALSYPAIRQGLAINDFTQRITAGWYPPLTYATGFHTFKSFFAGYSPCAPAYYALFVVAGLLVILGCCHLRKDTKSLFILLSISLVPMIANLIIWQSREFSHYEFRLFIFSAVAIAILVATALASIPSRWGQVGLLGAISLLTMPCLSDLFAHRLHPSENHRIGVRYRVDNRSAAQHIKAHWAPGDVVAHFCQVTLMSSKHYYLPQADHYAVGLTSAEEKGLLSSFPSRSIWQHIGALPQRIESVAHRAKRVWLIESWWEPFDVPDAARLYTGWLDHHAKRIERQSYFGVTLSLYDVESARGVPLKVARVADYPEFNVPAYQDQGRWRPADAIPLHASENNPETLFAVTTSLPGSFVQSSAIPLRIQLNRDSEGPIACDVFASTETIEPLAFTRESPDSDTWYPVKHTHPLLIDDLDGIDMVVKLDQETPMSPGIHADVEVPAGEYVLFARIWCEIANQNASRATLKFAWRNSQADSARQEIGEITPWRSQGASGWQWFNIGRIAALGQGVLSVVGYNKDSLPDAYADLGRIVFVPVTQLPEDMNYGPIATFSIVPRDFQDGGRFDYRLPEAARQFDRVDLLFRDVGKQESRRLTLYRAQADENVHASLVR